MQNKIYALITTIFIITNSSRAQEFKCLLIDSKTNEAVSFASIYSSDFNINKVADDAGVFYINKNLIQKNDTLFITRLGYETKNITLSDLNKSTCTFNLTPVEYNLMDVTVISTKLTWGEIMHRAIQTLNPKSLVAFESDITHNISIYCNNIEQISLKGRGFFHDEGFDVEQLLLNRQDYSWSIIHKLDIFKKPTINIQDYRGYQVSNETMFESRAIKFLFPLSIKRYDYKLKGIEFLGSDTVYKIEAKPKKESVSFLKLVDRKLFGSLYSFFLADKIFYINNKSFEFVRIDFDYPLVRNIGDKGVVLKKIFGYCNFTTSNGAIHPLLINVSHEYENKSLKQNYLRNDLMYFSNIKKETLSNIELAQKYKLLEVKGTFPGRTKRFDSDLFYNKNSFIYVHGVKFD